MYLILGRVVLFSLNQIPYSATKSGALLLIMYTFNSVLRYFDGARKRIVQLLVILSKYGRRPNLNTYIHFTYIELFSV